MLAYNENPSAFNDKADKLLDDMLHLKDNMVENIESLIQRDGKIEVIAEKALQLSTVSNTYKNRSRKLKNQERRKRYCQIFVAIVILGILISVIFWAIFGGKSDSKDDKDEPSSNSDVEQLESKLFEMGSDVEEKFLQLANTVESTE